MAPKGCRLPPVEHAPSPPYSSLSSPHFTHAKKITSGRFSASLSFFFFFFPPQNSFFHLSLLPSDSLALCPVHGPSTDRPAASLTPHSPTRRAFGPLPKPSVDLHDLSSTHSHLVSSHPSQHEAAEKKSTTCQNPSTRRTSQLLSL